MNPKNANAQFQKDEAEQAAKSLRSQIGFVNASTEDDIEEAFDIFRRDRAGALIVSQQFIFEQSCPPYRGIGAAE